MTTTTKVWSYGAKAPREGASVVDAQISLAHRYYNRLIEIHRSRQDQEKVLRRKHVPGLEEAEIAIDQALTAIADVRQAIKLRNAAARRKTASPEDRAVLAECKQRLKSAKTARNELRASSAENVQLQVDLAMLWMERGEARRQARKSSGVFYGTYLKIEEAVEAAIAKFGPPRFRRWTGDGIAGAQIQHGLSVAKLLLGNDRRLKMEFLPTTRSPKRARPVLFWIRVASDNGKPIWAKIPAYYHRPLPKNAIIMHALIVRRQLGTRRHSDPNKSEGVWLPHYDWSVQLTIRQPAPLAPVPAEQICGIDLGWRSIDGELRVAYLVDEQGREIDFRLSKKLVSKWDKADSIKSVRDKLFNAAVGELRAWLAINNSPEWLLESCQHIGAWKAKGRLAGLFSHWQRFAGDEEIFQYLLSWQVKDAHLWEYEISLSRKARRTRLNEYRTFAARVQRQYGRIFMEDCDWRTLAKLPRPEENEVVNREARRNMRIASVGLLRQCLHAIGAQPISARDTTKICHLCGSLEDFDHAASLFHCCDSCGRTWDQDYNAARNLIARGKVLESTAVTTPPKLRGRWARRKAKRSQNSANSNVEQDEKNAQ